MDNGSFLDGCELFVTSDEVWNETISEAPNETIIGNGNGLLLTSNVKDDTTITLSITDTDGDMIDEEDARGSDEAKEIAENFIAAYLDVGGEYADNIETIEEREDEMSSSVEDMLETFASNVMELVPDYDYMVEDLKNIICGYLSDKGVSVYRPVYASGSYVEYPYSGEESDVVSK